MIWAARGMQQAYGVRLHGLFGLLGPLRRKESRRPARPSRRHPLAIASRFGMTHGPGMTSPPSSRIVESPARLGSGVRGSRCLR